MRAAAKVMMAMMLAWTALPGTAQAAWWQAKSRHFTVYSEGNDEKLRGFAERLEKFDYLLRRFTNVTDDQAGSPVQVYLLASDAKLRALTKNPNIGGFYTTSDRSAYAVLARGGKSHQFDFGAEEILFHEYTHHFMLHHFPAAYPAWYVEGFAEFFSVVKFPKDGSIEFGHIPLPRVPGLVLGQPYPLKQLLARDTDKMNPRDMDRFYGTAWLLTHYFIQHKSPRQAEIRQYLTDLANGVPDMHLPGYFDGGLDGLEKDLKAYMRAKHFISVLTPKEMKISPVTVASVDPVQGVLIEEELRFLHHPAKQELPAIVTAIRATATKFPDSAYAAALLAEAEWAAEQKDAALADADRAIAIDATLSRAYAVRAQVLLERAHDSDKAEDWKAALTAIVRANRADTEDPVPLALFYRYHAMRGGKMPDLGYDGLYKAFTLLPQSSDYRFNFVHAMAARGDYATASLLLDPIAYSPHASDMREAAIRLKAELDAQAAAKSGEKAKKPGNPAPAP